MEFDTGRSAEYFSRQVFSIKYSNPELFLHPLTPLK
jgi:hypothetical protein